MFWKKMSQACLAATLQNDFCVKIRWINCSHELATDTAWRENVKLS